jgi:hypothetical protein
LCFDVQKGKFLAAEKFALLPALLKYCSGEAQQCRVQSGIWEVLAALADEPL